MNQFSILLYLVFLGAPFIHCAPTNDQISMYDVIQGKCPSVSSIPKYKDNPLFKSCNDWKRISAVNTLSNENKKDILCLLYFNTFTVYCNHANPINISVSEEQLAKYDLDAICDNLEIIPKQLAPENNLHKVITNPDECKRLCSDEFGWPIALCKISYYFGHLEANPVKKINHLVPVNPSHGENKLPENPQVPPQVVNLEKSAVKKMASVASKAKEEKVITEDPNTYKEKELGAPKMDQEKPANVVNNPMPVKDQTTHVSVNNDNDNSEGANGDDKVTISNSGVKTVINEDTTLKKTKTTVLESDIPPAVQDVANQNTDQDSTIEKNPAPGKGIDNEDMNPIGADGDPGDDSLQQPNDGGESEEVEEPSNIIPNEKSSKSLPIDESKAVSFSTEMDGDSYFFTYFMLLCIIFIVGYVCYHNKQKILALILEGRRGKRQYRGRRPNSANYHKLDSNLEEAIASSCNKNTNNVIY